ncbi:OmpA family protein [Acidimicrobiaceae bacterium USS-CC1]|uniref:OmpA family protein n=1 Tax=Acidiferrimicrobium australe TaxID=2664430 RepID=A0ABW9QVX3_9ACTN|nr:OmpA family protein [Acidiferrimicrobium australe]
MSRRAKHVEEEAHDNHERWLLTYSDMITLLMVLFIVLFALGQTNIRKFNAFRQSFHTAAIQPAPVTTGGIGVLSADSAVQLDPSPATHDPHVTPRVGTNPAASSGAAQALAQTQAAIEAALRRAGLGSDVRFRTTADGLAVTIATDKILFPTDSATLLPLGIQVLRVITPILARIHNDLDIEGHTDNVPITGGPYPNNWALSTARALAVLEDLRAGHVPADRMVASGFADTRPLVPNTTPANRALNRRVEIVVLTAPLAS